MANIFEKLFGTYSDREIKRIKPLVEKINTLEDGIKKLSDAELKAKTSEFRARLSEGETLDDLLPEAFAVVREASSRVWVCAISTFSLSEELCFIRAELPR